MSKSALLTSETMLTPHRPENQDANYKSRSAGCTASQCIAENGLPIEVHVLDNDMSGLNVSTAPSVHPYVAGTANPVIHSSKFGFCPYVKEVLESESDLNVKKRAKSGYNVFLTTRPTADVTITPTASDAAQIEIESDPLTFTPTNWNTPQVVKVAAKHDQEAEPDVTLDFNTTGHPSLVYHTVASADPKYQALQQLVNENLPELPNKRVFIKDIDNVGVCISQDEDAITGSEPQCDTTGTITAGGYLNVKEEVRKGQAEPTAKQLYIRLLTKPSGKVSVKAQTTTVTNSLLNVQATISPAKLDFTRTNWMTPQPFVVRARDDDVYEKTESTDSRAKVKFTMESAQVFVEDDDSAGIRLYPKTTSSAAVVYEVVLRSKPITRVNIKVYTSASSKQATFSNGL